MKNYCGPARSLSEVKKAVAFATSQFGAVHQYDEQHKVNFLSPAGPLMPETTIVITSGERVVGTAFLVEREMFFPRSTRPVAFITSICIDPSIQGEGKSRLLMENAIRLASDRGSEVAIVVARRSVDHYYPKFGFHGLSQYALTEVKRPRNLEDGPRLIFFDNPLSFLNNLYLSTYRNQPGTCNRTEAVWNFVSWRIKRYDYKVQILEDGSAYALTSGNEIFEVAASSTIAYRRLLSQLFISLDTEVLRLNSVSATHPAQRSILDWDHSLRLRQCRFGGHLLRLLQGNEAGFEATARHLGISACLFDGCGPSFNLLRMDEV